jgi:hypothetical protein
MSAKICKKLVAGTVITFTFSDGEAHKVDTKTFGDDIREMAMVHGFSQKLGDSYAQVKNIAEAKEKFGLVLDSLKGGDWNRKGGGATGGIWLEAFAKATQKTLDEVSEAWGKMTDEQKAGVKAHPDVKTAHAELVLAKAKAAAKAKKASDAKPVDLGALFS